MRDLVILAYHRVLPAPMAQRRGTLAVTTEDFERQLRFFVNKGWNCVTLSELYDTKLRYHKALKKTLVVTFDDGYKDNYLFAFPILRKLNLRATVFVTVGFLDANVDLYFSDQLRMYAPEPCDFALSKDEMNEMASFGVEFGSHTISHPRLTKIPPGTAFEEIVRSKEILGQRLGREVDSFCYPFGDLNDEIIENVRRAGYKIGVVTPPRPGIPEGIFTMRRTGVYLSDSYPRFLLKCTSTFDNLREFSMWKTLRRWRG